MQRTQLAGLKMTARVLDVGIIAASFLLVMRLRAVVSAWWPFDLFPGEGQTLRSLGTDAHLEMLAIFIPAWLVGLHVARTYDHLSRSRAEPLFFRIARGVALGALIALTFLFLLRTIDHLSRTLFVGFGLVSTLGIFTARRVLVRHMRRRFERGLDAQNVVVVGTAEEAAPLLMSLRNHRDWGLRVVGVVRPDDDPGDPYARTNEPPVIGTVSGLAKLLEREPVDRVYVTGRAWEFATLRFIADSCEEVGVEFTMDANFLGLRVAQAELRDLGGNSILSFSSTPRDAEAMVIKRVMDVVLSIMALIALSPVMLTVAAIIKLEDPKGSVFFGQRRSGLFGRPFTMWKFRSMVADAEKLKASLEAANEMDGPVFKITHDPRITRIGRFIRKTSIDELPQFWNVLVGEMSLVGPRPPIPKEVEDYERWQMRRLSMKPGITCIWQTSGRNNIDFKTWMQLDLQYIDNWSLYLDVKLLVKTPLVVVLGTGAG